MKEQILKLINETITEEVYYMSVNYDEGADTSKVLEIINPLKNMHAISKLETLKCKIEKL